MEEGILIRQLKDRDIEVMSAAFAGIGWDKPVSLFQRYLDEQESGLRVVLIAMEAEVFCGYLTIVWASDYAFFRQQSIPEIVDFNVLPRFRRRGIGTILMDEAENLIAVKSGTAGIGVGLTEDYGAAHILYIKRGYIPDGRGLTQAGKPLSYGNCVIVNDDLTLYFTKRLTPSG